MPAAFMAIQQPRVNDDALDSINSFSFVPAATEAAQTNEQHQPPPSPPTTNTTASQPNNFTRPVHRAKSTPSLVHSSKKIHSSAASTATPSRPGTPNKHIPFPWGLLDNRFSNASFMTTSTSDRSSSGSMFNPKLFKRGSGANSPNPSMRVASQNGSQTQFTPLDSTTGQKDDVAQSIPSNTASSDMPKTGSTVKQQFSFASSNASDIGPNNKQPASNQKKTDPSSIRDRYGFKKQTQFVTQAQYDEWWSGYQHHLRQRKQKWVTLMKESGLSIENDQPVRFPAKSEKLKRYIRKGIPAEWRGNAWFFYAKGHEKLSGNKGLYDKLCEQTATLKNTDTELIERDLHRTFPDNVHFRSDTAPDGGKSRETEAILIKSLRRVLTTFSVYQPKIGYCQSLNFLTGLLLLFMDEEKAFWMLVIITQRYLPGVHEITLEGVNIDQGVLMLCLRESLPKLWDKVGVNFEGQHYNNILSKLPPITLCTAAWFMSGYIGILPIETVLRIWDCFFFEESKTFFRIALTIFKFAEPEIEHLDDPMEIFQVVQTVPKQLIDASALLSACFKRRNGFGHISQEEIRRLREFVRERRLQANLATLAQTKNGGAGTGTTGSGDDANDMPDPERAAAAVAELSRMATSTSTSTRKHHTSLRYTKSTRGEDANGSGSTQQYNPNDLSEFSNFKHAPRPLHFQLTKRMRSLRLSSSSTRARTPTTQM